MPPRRQVSSRAPATSTSSSRTTTKAKTTTATNPDILAAKLSSALTLSDRPSKGKEKVVDPEEQCLSAMRAVNSASKRLSAAVTAGWRPDESQPRTRGDLTAHDMQKLVEDTASKLNYLREQKSGDLDVERAASSIIGKLLSLELVRLPWLSSWNASLTYDR